MDREVDGDDNRVFLAIFQEYSSLQYLNLEFITGNPCLTCICVETTHKPLY